MFTLHPQLAADTFEVGDLALSKVLLMNNASLPWLIIVPRQANVREWYELEMADQVRLHTESMHIGRALMQEFKGDKLNIGALGNLVPQLHVHHIVRYESDNAWPAPAWGNISPQPYKDQDARERIAVLKRLIGV